VVGVYSYVYYDDWFYFRKYSLVTPMSV
jgi:hypothetical protein